MPEDLKQNVIEFQFLESSGHAKTNDHFIFLFSVLARGYTIAEVSVPRTVTGRMYT